MDDWGFDFVEVAQGADYLHDNGACLLLRHQLVLLQVEVQVVAFTELQNCTEPGREEDRDGHTQSHTVVTDRIQQLNVNRCRSTVLATCTYSFNKTVTILSLTY